MVHSATMPSTSRTVKNGAGGKPPTRYGRLTTGGSKNASGVRSIQAKYRASNRSR